MPAWLRGWAFSMWGSPGCKRSQMLFLTEAGLWANLHGSSEPRVSGLRMERPHLGLISRVLGMACGLAELSTNRGFFFAGSLVGSSWQTSPAAERWTTQAQPWALSSYIGSMHVSGRPARCPELS